MLLKVLLVLLILIVIYYLASVIVTWVAGDGKKLAGLTDATTQTVIPGRSVPRTPDSSYTYSVWFNVQDWNYRYGQEKVILTRDSKQGSPCPSIVLAPLENNVIVRTQYYVSSSERPGVCGPEHPYASHAALSSGETKKGLTYCCKNKELYPGVHGDSNQCIACSGPPCSSYSLGDRKKEAFESRCAGNQEDVGQGATSPDNKKKGKNKGSSEHHTPSIHNCIVQNIPLQKWVSLIVSSTSRQTDVYLNGELVNSCLLPGVVKNCEDAGIKITPDGGFKGATSNVRFIDHAVTPSQARQIFALGERGGWFGFMQGLFGVVLTLKHDGTEVGKVTL